MRKIEAPTLEEAYARACRELGCSINELEYEIVQYPSKGLFGLFAKPAVIVALAVPRESSQQATPPGERDAVASSGDEASGSEEQASPGREKTPELPDDAVTEEAHPAEEPSADVSMGDAKRSSSTPSEHRILEGFFSEESGESVGEGKPDEQPKESADAGERNLTLQREIEGQLRELMEKSCFDLDVVEVDVMDGTAYIFVDGEDAALLIGKEGYRYNALSYLLYQWIHGRYKLHTKLEVARFLTTQEEMIRSFIQPVIEHVEREGWGRTRPLDGVLVQIALEQLREAFPGKYVAAKRQRDGKRYILINEFHKRK